MTRLLRYLILPREISAFEATYLRRMNRIALAFFWLHPPAFAAVAALAGTSIGLALGLSAAVLVGPTLAFFAFGDKPRLVALTYGFTAMVMGGVLVYVGQGPMQIEMHFYFFVLIALLAVFGNPIVIVVAAATVAAHHLVVWLVLPAAVFNYDASVWTVAVHAIFVVLESVAACFVARSFFDNVIGLEKIVTKRTADLDGRNRDMALILDHVGQGFVAVGFDGAIGPERSRALTRWFGEPADGARWWDYLSARPDDAAWLELGFSMLADGVLPPELAIDQLPKRVERGGRHYGVEYQPIGDDRTMLAVVSDITDMVAGHRAELAQRELIAVVQKATGDRAGFLSFIGEAETTVARCTKPEPGASLAELKRGLHTLKGNAGMFAVSTIADLCHELETAIDEQGEPLTEAQRAQLTEAWTAFRRRTDPVLGITKRRTLIVDWEEYQSVIASLGRPAPSWAAPLQRWGEAPTRPYLERLGDQARALAARLGKPELEIVVEDGELRIDADRFEPIWSALIHAIRNAVDHGIEPAAVRSAAGKQAAGRIRLATELTGDRLVVEVTDDGAGIDWARVETRARALGLPVATPRDLEAALFTSGMTTALELSEVSGRGVGLDALSATCRRLDGTVQISSGRGIGSTVRCELPLAPVSMHALRATS